VSPVEAAAGKVKATKLGSRVLVDVASLKAFVADQPANTDAPVIKRPRSPCGRFARVKRKAAPR
jgi:hypothetical protein